jgi:hypothetical protein
MCLGCLARRARGRGPYPELSDAEMRAGLDLLPTWVLQQKAAANRRVIAAMRERLERGAPVAAMYGPLGLAWLQRQAELAEQLIRACGRPPPLPSAIGGPVRAEAYSSECSMRLRLLQLRTGGLGGGAGGDELAQRQPVQRRDRGLELDGLCSHPGGSPRPGPVAQHPRFRLW